MKISYKWLQDYLKTELSPEALTDRMTFAGIEVEGIEELGARLKQIRIAKIETRIPHPGSDHLSICTVNDGTETLQVICGAPNCAAGQVVPFAPVGASFGDFTIKKTKLRGELSFGMICSEKELELSDNHDGIMVLPPDAPIGTDMASYLGLADTCYEVEITPNRPDLLGILGVARDLSALLQKPLITPKITLPATAGCIRDTLAIENQAPDLCTRYTARMVQGVTIAESPQWLKDKLLSVGLRPINNVVDVTNFVMMEYGHPLHAFDFAQLAESRIIIRRAADGEAFSALDGETYRLSSRDLVIADAEKPVALAGVIGGDNSQITEHTTDIVIEAANFLYSTVRKTSGRLKIFTDSSYRFERDIADETTEIVSARAAQLIVEIAGGTLLDGVIDVYPAPKPTIKVSVRPSRVEKLLTVAMDGTMIKDYLKALGLECVAEAADELTFSIPPYRKDLTREIDLIEELIRLHGYNNVEPRFFPQTIMNRRKIGSRRMLQDIMVSYGYSEIVNWSFGDPEDMDHLKLDAEDDRRKTVPVKNPLGARFSVMRSSLIPGLLKTASYNLNHGAGSLKLFELNKVFFSSNEKLPMEREMLSGLATGALHETFWKEKNQDVDFYDVKGVVEEILEQLGTSKLRIVQSADSFYQAGVGADILYRNSKVASCGKIDPKVAEAFDIGQPIFGFEVYFDTILESGKVKSPVFAAIPKVPPVVRDLSFVVSKEHSVADITKTIRSTNPQLIKRVVLFDEYTGKNITPGSRSLTFSIVIGSDIKTLTDEFTNKILQKIMKKLEAKHAVEMR
ncbi:MAG: phenylalanine--tRNA ligase subunit beta [Candidatus Cloacimonetes bacterium]|nr:phenylalanine--tRNA ligase subunit beta [Candidatus Cloacimonadota bacterium]